MTQSSAPQSHTDLAEIAMASVIDAALASRQRWAPKHWYSSLLAELDGTDAKPPSLSRFESRIAAERKRRRTAVLEASARAVETVGSSIGDLQVEILPGAAPVGRRGFELVVTALTEWRSARIGDAFRDYCQVAHRTRERTVPEEVFRKLIFSQPIVDGVPHELLPDWWRRKLLLLTR